MEIVEKNGKRVLDYQPEPELFFEYFGISKQISGLKYNLMSDCSKAYIDRNQPQLIYVQLNELSEPQHYYKYKHIPITVDNNTRVIGNINDTKISLKELFEIKKYIISNKGNLVKVANMTMDWDDYKYHQYSYPELSIINESLFKGRKMIVEMPNLYKHDTGLNNNVWVDKSDRDSPHSDRVKIQNNYSDNITRDDMIPISLHDLKLRNQPNQKINISSEDIKRAQHWVLLNTNMLKDKENLVNFDKKDVIKIDKNNNPIYPFEGYIKKEVIYPGITAVENNKKMFNFIDKNGKLLSKMWFRRYDYVQNKVISVELENGEWYKLTLNGKLFK